MTPDDYERCQHDMLAHDTAAAAQDAAYAAHCLDWTRVDMLSVHTPDGEPIGFWRNHFAGSGLEWSRNLIANCVDYDEHWEDEHERHDTMP